MTRHRSGCRNCGERGHTTQECNYQFEEGCFVCGQPGHMAANCTNSAHSSTYRRNDCFATCRVCGKTGHSAQQCRRRDFGCTYCGEKGHSAQQCPKEDSDTGNESEASVFDKKGSLPSTTINFDGEVSVSIPIQKISPIKLFEDLDLVDQLQKNIASCGYTNPTELQKYALPVICKGKDVLVYGDESVIDETATFVLPMINVIKKLDALSFQFNSNPTPFAIVTVPTRELVIEVEKEVCKFSQNIPCKTQIAYDGKDIENQFVCNILIGTHERVKQLIADKTISLHKVELLVIVEADKMLANIGSRNDIGFITTALGMTHNNQRQTLLFSATHTEEVQTIADKLLKNNYRLVTVGVIIGKLSIKVSVPQNKEPIAEFTEITFGHQVQCNIRRCGYIKPTPIQKYALPIICNGYDVLACSQTGTGKTAAFVLPLIKYIEEIGFSSATDRLPQKPEAMIITPTRELAIQIYDDIQKFTYKAILCKARLAYGGAPADRQRDRLKIKCNILIGTPGRIKHFIKDGTISLENIRFFVLDEADKMLDMGFKSDIDFFAEDPYLPPKHERQTILFSATYAEGVQQVAEQFLDDEYRKITMGEIGSAQPNVTQVIIQVDNKQKTHMIREVLGYILGDEQEEATLARRILGDKPTMEHNEENEKNILENILGEVLEKGGKPKILIFITTKRNAADLSAKLFDDLYETFKQHRDQNGYQDLHEFGITSMHGDKCQSEREAALEGFKNGIYQVLVATAVAARGLDIPGITHVINYDMPDRNDIDEYVNKIGRTGRAGNKGTAISFFQPDRDGTLVAPIFKILRNAQQDIPQWFIEKFKEMGGIY